MSVFDQLVGQVTVAVAPPQQHDVDDLVGVLVQQIFAEELLDGLADGGVRDLRLVSFVGG